MHGQDFAPGLQRGFCGSRSTIAVATSDYSTAEVKTLRSMLLRLHANATPLA